MMKMRASIFGVLLCLVSIADAVGQDAESHPAPTLYLYAEQDQSIWFDLYLHPEPAEPEKVSAALATMVSDDDPESVAGYYDGFDEVAGASWSGYWNDALGAQGLLVTGAIELEPLRAALVELGATVLVVEIYQPDAGFTQAVWSEPSVVIEGDNDWNATTLPLDRPIPALQIAFGFTPASLVLWYAPVLLCTLLLFLYTLMLRRAGMGRPEAEVGFACFSCTRGSLYSILAYWAALLLIVRTWNPLLPLEYAWDWSWYDLTEILLRDGMVVALATCVSIGARSMVFPIYERFPGATWTRRDFVVQTFWASALAGLMVMCFGTMTWYLEESPARAVTIAIFAGMVGAALYWQLLHAMRLEFESVEVGPLRERVDHLAQIAGISRINGVYLVRMGKAPLLNAFASNNARVLVTDYLLRQLTIREVDAILAHEVSHLKRRHPERLRNIMALNFVLLSYGAIALYLVGAAMVEQFTELPPGAMSMPAIALSALPGAFLARYVHLRYARRFEREADDGALALIEDPEAQISSLLKITRMNYMPLVWGGAWRERFLTHPSTLARIRRIAERGAVPPERLEALLAGGCAPEDSRVAGDDYMESITSGRRYFTTSFKLTTLRLNSFVMLVLPALGATASVWLWSLGVPPMPGWAALPLAIAIAMGLCALFQNRAAVRGYDRLARWMREDLAEELAGEAGYFVTFTPDTEGLLYDGYNNWDVGLLRFNGSDLQYFGDGTVFGVPRERIQKVDLVYRANSIIPSAGIHVTWGEPGESGYVRTFLFRAGDAKSLLSMNRATRGLHRDLVDWVEGRERGGATPLKRRLPLPEKLEAKGQRVADVISTRVLLGFLVKYALCGFATAQAVGLPALAPFEASSAGVAVATGIAVMLFVFPLWRIGRACPTA